MKQIINRKCYEYKTLLGGEVWLHYGLLRWSASAKSNLLALSSSFAASFNLHFYGPAWCHLSLASPPFLASCSLMFNPDSSLWPVLQLAWLFSCKVLLQPEVNSSLLNIGVVREFLLFILPWLFCWILLQRYSGFSAFSGTWYWVWFSKMLSLKVIFVAWTFFYESVVLWNCCILGCLFLSRLIFLCCRVVTSHSSLVPLVSLHSQVTTSDSLLRWDLPCMCCPCFSFNNSAQLLKIALWTGSLHTKIKWFLSVCLTRPVIICG